MSTVAEQQVLRSLIESYSNGLDNGRWHPSISLNPSLTAQVVIDNPNIEWDNLLLLKNPNLDVDFRLEILEKMDLNELRTGNNDVHLILDLPILKAIIEKLEGEARLLYSVLNNGVYTVESIEWIYRSEYRNRVTDQKAVLSSIEVADWLIHNRKPLNPDVIEVLISEGWMTSEWADYLIEDGIHPGFCGLVCYSSRPVEILTELIDGKYGDVGDTVSFFKNSPSAEFTKLLIESFETPDRSGLILGRAPIDNKMAIQLLRMNRTSITMSILKNKGVTNRLKIQYLRQVAHPNNAEWILSILSISRTATDYMVGYEISCYMAEILDQYSLPQYSRSQIVRLMATGGMEAASWIVSHGGDITVRVHDCKSLLMVRDSCVPRIKTVEFKGDITSEVIEIASQPPLVRTSDWTLLSANVDYELVVSYPNMPWDREVLATRKYQLPARFAYTKRVAHK